MLEAKEYKLLYDKRGIEIGGSSKYFDGDLLPLYDRVRTIDNVLFSDTTIWHGKQGNVYNVDGKTGHQYFMDAVDMSAIQSEKYDFVVNTNTLEHIANPIKAMKEFLRILKPGGLILLILPDKTSNFERTRSITKFTHLLYDYENDTAEDDLSHLGEHLLHCDPKFMCDPNIYDLLSFTQRSLKNFENRCFHHHVFDMNLLEQLFEFLNIEIVREDKIPTDYIILGRKK
jgi:SAM-dependent methyltransferase